MISLQAVTKSVIAAGRKRHVLSSVSLTIPSDRRIALLGPSAEDKKILVDILAGISLPTSGHIVRNARVSFPIGHIGGVSGELSVRMNVAHVAHLYGVDVNSLVDFVQQTAALGEAFGMPYSDLPHTVKRQIAQIIGYSIPFDMYLLRDEIARRRPAGKDKSYALFEARARTSGMIIPTQDSRFASECCDMGLILHRGRLRLFENVARAISVAEKLKGNAPRTLQGSGRSKRGPR